MAEHTPGPWKWDGYDIRGPKDEIILTSDGRFGSDADCILIAAAPELLAALKEMIQWGQSPLSDNARWSAAGRRALAAIAKAEGKS